MKVLLIKPGQEPENASIPDDLQAIQRFLGGPVEALQFPTDWAALLCNMNGPFQEDAQPNRIYKGKIIYGPFLVAGSSRCRYKSLTAEQRERYCEMFKLGGAGTC